MQLYKLLGVDPEIIDYWSQVHDKYKIKGNKLSFDAYGMRLTG